MKFSELWLREWVNHPLLTNQLVQQFTMIGLEVESVTPVAAPFNQVVVGEVLSVAPHPQAEKLTICQVKIGAPAPLNIVCGASNVRAGMRVPTALAGAQLPDLKIETTTLRGVLSEGMLCSAKELGLADSAEGILPLPNDAPVGKDLREYLQLDDTSIEINIMPNRGDCLSIAGIAREVSVLTNTEVHAPPEVPIVTTINDTFPVELLHTSGCPRYVGRIIKNVDVQAPTPLWMQERLRRSGQRNISAVVDVTNYVLLELGQPLHAFDLTKLSGGIRVRLAQAGETLTLLDGQTVPLDDKTLIIADHQRPVAMAGIMGGLETAVTAATQDIFLESAFFSPLTLAGCARRYGLQTDASYRFERGVDPQLQRHAVERATTLLLEIVGGQPGPIVEVVDQAALPVIPTITLRASRIRRLLGDYLNHDTVSQILTRLGMTVVPTPVPPALAQNEFDEFMWQVTPPSYRFDCTIEADLIEEIARVYGYNHIRSRSPLAWLTMHPQPVVTLEQLQTVLVQRDYQEIITYSFVDADVQAILNPNTPAMALANPIAKRLDNPTAIDMSVMRTTLWTGLIQTLRHNQTRQQTRLRLFETGLRFIQTPDQGLQQEPMIAGLISGPRFPEQWGITTQPIDFFDLKSDVTALLNFSQGNPEFKPSTHPALHPGQTAAIYRGDELIGLLGALHPRLIQQLELTAPVYLFELRLVPLLQSELPKFREVSKYPSLRRDIAIVIDTQVSAVAVLTQIRTTASNLLTHLFLFDVYQGEHLAAGQKSLAIGLIFQAFSRNLTELEVDTEIKQILSVLEQQLSASLRK
jgi:phenylalanyl-tRNA synthetase beta chain